MKNQFSYRLWGKYALFTDPTTKLGGEKSSYQIPTYQALKGITESIYWKPTIQYVIDEVRIINPIQMESKGIRPMIYSSQGNNLAYYSYLKNPEYEVKAHFIFNKNREDLRHDYNENKHYQILKRCIEKGGRRDIFLGTRECQGYVAPCNYGVKEGSYDNISLLSFGTMLHGVNYPDETGENKLGVRLWQPMMKEGIIKFIKPEECLIQRELRDMTVKTFNNDNFQSVDTLYDELDGRNPFGVDE